MKCRICGSAGPHREFRVKEMHFGTRQEFDYFQCAECDCLQIVGIPADLSGYYPKDYYSTVPIDEKKYTGLRGLPRLFFFKASLYQDSPLRQLISKIRANKHAASISGLGITPRTRVLDVGCGNGGLFAYPLKQIGFESVARCDPFLDRPMEYSNGLHLYQNTLAEVPIEPKWDVITFHHSFEHVPNPSATLHAVHRLLGDNGTCVIRIPTSSSFAWDHYGVNWVQLDAPRHLFLHSVESLRRVAQSAGFEVKSVRYDSDEFQFWGSENYLNGIPLKDQKKRGTNTRLAWLILRWRLKFRSIKLNRQCRGDQAVFVLKKKG